ncbi:calcium-binding and coiled-coil domain-containing protein 2 isoform X2 [Ambystoma mexicanum]|uniref:calcium-binding and coiled-coil domain-containing protein 2 isoform X2 n=1 Tax=Ambystoma mexicanum TaxID=8296 RepID=UPI0037E93816
MASMAEESDPPISIVFLENHSYSHVVFDDVKQSYAPGVDLTCHYSLSKHIAQRSKDWLGIFKVGWTTPRDYFTFVWVPTPSNTSTGAQEVLFKAYYLPKDEEEYYQFCYVDQDGAVRGASSPFRFHLEEDEDMVIVPSPEVLEDLQEQNKRILGENQELKENSELLSKECNDIQALLKVTQETVTLLENEKVALQSQNVALQSQNADLQVQNADLQSLNKGLQNQNIDLRNQREDLVPTSQLRAVEVELLCAKEEIGKISAQKQELEKHLESGVVREQKLDLKVKALKEEEGDLRRNYRSCEAERNQLRDLNQKLRTEGDVMKKNLQLALDQIDRLQTEKADLKKEIGKMYMDSEDKAKHLKDIMQEKEQMQCTVAMQMEHAQKLEKLLQQERQDMVLTRKREETVQQQLALKMIHKKVPHSSITQKPSLTRTREEQRGHPENAGFGKSDSKGVETETCLMCGKEMEEDLVALHIEMEHTLKCPTCSATYSELERQVYDDHLYCHTVQEGF